MASGVPRPPPSTKLLQRMRGEGAALPVPDVGSIRTLQPQPAGRQKQRWPDSVRKALVRAEAAACPETRHARRRLHSRGGWCKHPRHLLSVELPGSHDKLEDVFQGFEREHERVAGLPSASCVHVLREHGDQLPARWRKKGGKRGWEARGALKPSPTGTAGAAGGLSMSWCKGCCRATPTALRCQTPNGGAANRLPARPA